MTVIKLSSTVIHDPNLWSILVDQGYNPHEAQIKLSADRVMFFVHGTSALELGFVAQNDLSEAPKVERIRSRIIEWVKANPVVAYSALPDIDDLPSLGVF